MAFLNKAVSVAFLAVGFSVSGNWQKTVLNLYSVNCTLLPDPAPYPYHLRLLADGNVTIKGLKELFACEPEPLLGGRVLSP